MRSSRLDVLLAANGTARVCRRVVGRETARVDRGSERVREREMARARLGAAAGITHARAARFPEVLWRPDVERAVLGAASHAYRPPVPPIGARPLPRMQDGVRTTAARPPRPATARNGAVGAAPIALRRSSARTIDESPANSPAITFARSYIGTTTMMTKTTTAGPAITMITIDEFNLSGRTPFVRECRRRRTPRPQDASARRQVSIR